MDFYKLVYEVRGDNRSRYYSVFVNGFRHDESEKCEGKIRDLEVEYIPDQFVKPKQEGTKLFVYTDLAQAIRNVYHENVSVWRCEVKNPVELDRFADLPTNIYAIVNFVFKRRLFGFYDVIDTQDVALCDEVKLTEKIRERQYGRSN